MRWKNFLYFSTAEKIAVLILMVAVIFFFGLNIILSSRSNVDIVALQNDSIVVAFQQMEQSLKEKEKQSKSKEYKSKKEPKTQSHQHTPQVKQQNSPHKAETKNYSAKPQYVKHEKFTEPNSISLNETDTAQWKKIPGIGSVYASRIVKYQRLLGGYRSVDQLKEVYGITDEQFTKMVPFVREDVIEAKQCVKIKINQLEFKEILAHPYINYEQTKAIVNLRRRTGNIASLEHLSMLEEFAPVDIERISPYIDFNL